MSIDKKTNDHKLNRNDLLFAGLISMLCAFFLLIDYGVETPFYYNFSLIANKNIGGSNPDINIDFIKASTPLFYYFFHPIYNIPLAHFFFGFLFKFLTYFSLYILIFKHYGKQHVIASFALGLVFLVPIGTSSFGIRSALSFSNREVATIFLLLSLNYFLSSRYILSAVLIGIGSYFHQINSLHLFLYSLTTLLIISLSKKESFPEQMKKLLRYLPPFLLLFFPHLLRLQGFKSKVTKDIISTGKWWDFLLKNEPDDVSLLFMFREVYSYKYEIALSIFAIVIIYITRKYGKNTLSPGIFMKSQFLVISVWLLIGFALLYEKYVLIYAPDFINDFFIPFQFKKSTVIPSLIYIPVISFGVVQFILFFRNKMPLFKRGILVFSDRNLAVICVLILLCVRTSYAAISGVREFPANIAKFLNSHYQPYSYFESSYKYLEEFSDVNSADLIDACNWVRNKIPVTDGLLAIPYSKEVFLLAERQTFLSEKMDGDLALWNRVFATMYLERFSDLLNGLTYADFDEPCYEGGKCYSTIRTKFLGLREEDFIRIAVKYPQYSYVLTEREHKLDFTVVYSNRQFVLYKIGSGSKDSHRDAQELKNNI